MNAHQHIDINAAEQVVVSILPQATRALENNVINTKGMFLLFKQLVMENGYTGEVGYEFTLYVSINSLTRNQTLAYQPLSECLSSLLVDYQTTSRVAIGRIKPNAAKALIIYEVQLTYTPCVHQEDHLTA